MAKNKTLIYISGTPISKIQGDKYNISQLTSQGLEVEYWNLTNIFYSKKALDIYFGGHPKYRFEFKNELVFYNIASFKKYLDNVNKDEVLICLVDFLQQSYFWMLREFKRKGLKYYVGPMRTTHAYDVNRKPLFRKILRAIVDGSIITKITKTPEGSNINNLLLYKLRLYLYKRTNYYQRPDFVIGSGKLGRVEWTNKCSIDNFISARSKDVLWDLKPRLIEEPYCVYVDESIIYSPDRGLWEETTKNSASDDFEYFRNNMCAVFDTIEKSMGVRVVIAASGKYKYPNERIYNNREIIYDNTNILIQGATLVIGHTSTGMYQAIIDRKPVIILNDPSFSKYKNKHVVLFSKFLNARLITTTDFSSDSLKGLEKNEKHYAKLEQDYFKEKDDINEFSVASLY